MLNPKLYSEYNVHLTEQGNAELASSILATLTALSPYQHVINP